MSESRVRRLWKANRRRLAWLAGILAALYVTSGPVLLAFEDRLLFIGSISGPGYQSPKDYLEAQSVTIISDDGERIDGWFTRPPGWKPAHGAVLFSHGSGASISTLSGRAFHWREYLGRAVLVYDYPGYGRSTGSPTEAGSYAAGRAAFAWLTAEQRVAARDVVLVGESLGGAVATELASTRDARMLVLVGAFTSFPDMAEKVVPWLPGRHFVRNRLNNEEKLRGVSCPVLVAHGERDAVVPRAHAERLYAAAAGPKRLVFVADQGHRHPRQPEFFAEVKAFLTETRE